MNSLIRLDRSIDCLEEELLASWQAVTQATHQFLTLLQEFDLRQGWREWGAADCADWMNLKCGITRATAQEKLRVAAALFGLPQIDEAFRQGHISYSKVRALTRIAQEHNETDLLEYALGASAAQVEVYCRRLRNGDASEGEAARAAQERRYLSRSFRDDGTGTIHVELPCEEIELVMRALEFIAQDLPLPDDETSMFAKGADALVQMARVALDQPQPSSASPSPAKRSSEHYQVMVQIEAKALEGHGGESSLPLETVRRLCCDGSVVPVITNQGEPLAIGRKQRTIPTAVRRALLVRDKACSFPGCTHTQWLDAHHIRHWAEGGETNLENLILLCTHHHRLLHEGGFKLHATRDAKLRFTRSDGRPIEAHQYTTLSEVKESAPVYRLNHFPRKVDSTQTMYDSQFPTPGKPPEIQRSPCLTEMEPDAATH
jgi:hypothetical protein